MTKKLTLIDGILLVAGSMIGSGIFIVSADMGRTVGGPGWLLVLWLLAGVMTILAALSYGELAGMMPEAGGQYVYLRRAFGPLLGFLYGWTLFLVIQCGTIAAVAVAFAKFSSYIIPSFSDQNILLKIGSLHISAAQVVGILCIVFLTYLNSKGIKYVQFIIRYFSSAKLIALFGLIFLGIIVFRDDVVWSSNLFQFFRTDQTWVKEGEQWVQTSLSTSGLLMAMGVGMVGSLFSSEAWNNITFIGGEMDNPKRNIPLSMVLGTVVVTAIYILANISYLSLLPFYGNPEGTDVLQRGVQFATNDRVGVEAAKVMFGGVSAPIIMAILIMVSTFACNNGLILSGARVYQAMAKNGLFFKSMIPNNTNEVPSNALWIQCIWCSILCLSGKYGQLLDYVIFAVLIFYILTILAIFRLRRLEPDTPRPIKAWGYPFIPFLYIILAAAISLDLLYMKPEYTWPGLIIVLVGIPVYYLFRANLKTSSDER
ncbi:MAG: amino acid permease [Saprospiraceae bacterium]|nr:amino acid permease [Saprospiraceae bacterium]